MLSKIFGDLTLTLAPLDVISIKKTDWQNSSSHPTPRQTVLAVAVAYPL